MKRIALISNDEDMCKLLKCILPLEVDSTVEGFLKNGDINFDVILIDINRMGGQCLKRLLELNIESKIVKIISSVPYKYLPQNYRSLLNKFEENYLVKPFNLYSFREELL